MNPQAPEQTGPEKQTASKNREAIVPPWALSTEIWVMMRPAAAYVWLADSPAAKEKWTWLRRPLFMALLIGCMVSLVTSQRLTLRHVAGGAVSGCLLLAWQITALTIVCGRERKQSFSRTVDFFFAGYGPWTLWILAFSAVWAFLSARHAFVFGGAGSILPTAGFVAFWSLYIHFRFFERVMQRSRLGAAWDVVRLCAMCWSVFILNFGWGALWPEFLRITGR
jgi:hypothetical protein